VQAQGAAAVIEVEANGDSAKVPVSVSFPLSERGGVPAPPKPLGTSGLGLPANGLPGAARGGRGSTSVSGSGRVARLYSPEE
jgi:hypothetical protein